MWNTLENIQPSELFSQSEVCTETRQSIQEGWSMCSDSRGTLNIKEYGEGTVQAPQLGTGSQFWDLGSAPGPLVSGDF